MNLKTDLSSECISIEAIAPNKYSHVYGTINMSMM